MGQTTEAHDDHFRCEGHAIRAGSLSAERREALRTFAVSLERSFCGFEPDFFQQNLICFVDDVVSQIKGSQEIWPTLVEICFLRKPRAGLPRRKVENRVRA